MCVHFTIRLLILILLCESVYVHVRVSGPPPLLACVCVCVYLGDCVSLHLYYSGSDGRGAGLQAAVLPQQTAHIHRVQEHLLAIIRYRNTHKYTNTVHHIHTHIHTDIHKYSTSQSHKHIHTDIQNTDVRQRNK